MLIEMEIFAFVFEVLHLNFYNRRFFKILSGRCPSSLTLYSSSVVFWRGKLAKSHIFAPSVLSNPPPSEKHVIILINEHLWLIS